MKFKILTVLLLMMSHASHAMKKIKKAIHLTTQRHVRNHSINDILDHFDRHGMGETYNTLFKRGTTPERMRMLRNLHDFLDDEGWSEHSRIILSNAFVESPASVMYATLIRDCKNIEQHAHFWRMEKQLKMCRLLHLLQICDDCHKRRTSQLQ